MNCGSEVSWMGVMSESGFAETGGRDFLNFDLISKLVTVDTPYKNTSGTGKYIPKYSHKV